MDCTEKYAVTVNLQAKQTVE